MGLSKGPFPWVLYALYLGPLVASVLILAAILLLKGPW